MSIDFTKKQNCAELKISYEEDIGFHDEEMKLKAKNSQLF